MNEIGMSKSSIWRTLLSKNYIFLAGNLKWICWNWSTSLLKQNILLNRIELKLSLALKCGANLKMCRLSEALSKAQAPFPLSQLEMATLFIEFLVVPNLSFIVDISIASLPMLFIHVVILHASEMIQLYGAGHLHATKFYIYTPRTRSSLC